MNKKLSIDNESAIKLSQEITGIVRNKLLELVERDHTDQHALNVSAACVAASAAIMSRAIMGLHLVYGTDTPALAAKTVKLMLDELFSMEEKHGGDKPEQDQYGMNVGSIRVTMEPKDS